MKSTHTLQVLLQRRLREGIFILCLAVSFFMLLALVTYHVADPGWSHLATHSSIKNSGGEAGAWFADLTLSLLGYLAYLVPFLLSYLGWLYLHDQFGMLSNKKGLIWMRLIGFLLVLLSGTALCHLNLSMHSHFLPFQAGGILGYVIGSELLQIFNSKGTNLILFALLLMGVTLSTGFSWISLLETIGKYTIKIGRSVFAKSQSSSKETLETSKLPTTKIEPKFEGKTNLKAVVKEEPKMIVEPKIIPKSAPKIEPKVEMKTPVKVAPKISNKPESQGSLFPTPTISSEVKTAARSTTKSKTEKTDESLLTTEEAIPSLSLLEPPANDGYRLSDEELEEKSREVEVCLNDFSVEAKVVAVHPGPVVTRYELELAAGTKVSKITNLVKDLARSLSVISVRVVEVIPGKSVIGIELPNVKREVVSLREMLSSSAYQNSKSAISLALGKDIAGHPVVVDVAKMPHLLVAGTTGSGKSVCLNAILLSFLYKALPSQLRLILIDPKMLEFSIYDGIPHLLTPVVTDMKDAAKALRWCVIEMERRYRLMASLGVRNIANYNQKVKEARERGAPLLDPICNDEIRKELEEMPQIVIMADEFADMMMVVGKKIETLIARLAQKARAAGVHLILATQRPSVDVITGLIKANIPTRVAFQVSSKIDSRTILDQQGAEQLLGHGDMLYLPPGSGVPVRIHGAFVSDDEVHQVVTFLKQSGKPEYLDEVLDDHPGDEFGGSGGGANFSEGEGSSSSEDDPLFDEAVKFVTQSRRVSISSIQRRFKIGYNRAARIVDSMEASGVVSAMETNGSREVIAPPPVE